MLLTCLWRLSLDTAALNLVTVGLAIRRLFINDRCSIGNMAVAVWLKRFSRVCCFVLCSFGFFRFTTCSFGFIVLGRESIDGEMLFPWRVEAAESEGIEGPEQASATRLLGSASFGLRDIQRGGDVLV